MVKYMHDIKLQQQQQKIVTCQTLHTSHTPQKKNNLLFYIQCLLH